MKLRNSKVVLPSSAPVNPRCNLRFDAHQDNEVFHYRVSMDSSDISSDTHQSVAASTSLLSAECLLSGMTRGQRKWTYEENTELMNCFYLAKLDGVGYHGRLKSLWDSRNPAKSAISVNTLCCHAHNIQVSHLLTDYDLKQIQAVCEPAAVELPSGPTEGTTGDISIVADPEPPLADTTLDHALQFLNDSLINRTLGSRFTEISSAGIAALPC